MKIDHKDGEFFAAVGGKRAVLEYAIKGNRMNIFHTFTDPELRGRGLAERLAQAAFEYAKNKGLCVIPTCSYVRDYFLPKHGEWKSIVDE